jgi:hypothetical protein
VDEDEAQRGDEVPYRPWWLTPEGMERMRELEQELDELLKEQVDGSLQGH